MTPPKDYLTDRVKEEIELIVDSAFVQGWEAALKLADKHSIDVQVQAILSLLTSEVERTVKEVIGDDEVYTTAIGSLYDERVTRNQLRKVQRKALSDIGGKGVIHK